MTKVIIAGSRTFNNYSLLKDICDDFLIGFEDIESFYSEMEYNEEMKGFEYFISSLDTDKFEISENALPMLSENKGGYYSILTSGLDYCESDLIQYCLDENIIKEITESV